MPLTLFMSSFAPYYDIATILDPANVKQTSMAWNIMACACSCTYQWPLKASFIQLVMQFIIEKVKHKCLHTFMQKLPQANLWLMVRLESHINDNVNASILLCKK